MRNILENYTPDTNFWESVPQFTTVNPFRSIWKSDKSRGKKRTSDLMWAIALIHHPKSDIYYIDGKEYMITKDMLGVKESDCDAFWVENKHLVDAFIDAALTQAQKSLLAWNNRMQNRDEFLAEQTYTFGYTKDGITYSDNTKSLDDMAAKTSKIYDEYFKVEQKLKEEESINMNVKIKSATASGEI